MDEATAGGSDGLADWEEEGGRLASRALAQGDPTGWFDELYSAGASGRAQLAWSRREAHPLLVDWAQARSATAGAGRRAVVVGCGLGADAEYLAGLGFDTTGFDVSPTAIRLTRERFPGTTVHYQVADLLKLPTAWRRAFDLVVEIITVQALPRSLRAAAIARVRDLVAPGGTLLVISAVQEPDVPVGDVPPWPLRRDEIDAFAGDGLEADDVELVAPADQPGRRRWRATFHRRLRAQCGAPPDSRR